ncbi:MAG: DUF624 domain-containing protein [Treponema sp.]|jgi:uncharacterized membrane protein YesL|nr:DUF624 domain-containing protein [Treponema sp.]
MKGAKTKRRLFEGGLHVWMEKLFDIMTLNLIWLLCSLPLVTIGAAATAFYYAMVKVIRGERGHLWSEFWRSFKLNFVKATLVWICFAALVFLLLVNRNITADIGGYFGAFLLCFYTALAAVFFAILMYVFPVLSRFHMTIPEVLKLSVYMCFRYLHYTLALLSIAAGAAALLYFMPLFVFIVPAGALFCFSRLMEPLLIRHTPGTADENGQWYLGLAPRAGKK